MMNVDFVPTNAPSVRLPDARGPPLALIASCECYPEIGIEFSKSPGWGGARANSGGARMGAGRPRKTLTNRPEGLHWYVVRVAHHLPEESQVRFRFARTALDDDTQTGSTRLAHATLTALAEFEIDEAGFEILTARICRPAARAYRSPSGTYVRAREERFDPLFVRYIIVRLDLADPSWHLIPAMDSVERIISGGHLANNGIGVPIPVTDAAIQWLRGKLSPVGIFYPPGYRAPVSREEPIDAGLSLHMPDGIMPDRAGICEMSDGERVVMLMGWFNRDNVRTTVRQSAVEVI